MTTEYTTALVSFVDILGFKALIETESAESILGILHGKAAFGLERQSMRRGGFLGGNPKTFNFSDLIVNVDEITKDYESDGSVVHLVHNHFRRIGFVQWKLACEGIFVRGGVTLGQIYTEGATVFGPALIRAYELESQTAKWPIIAIDKQALEEFDRQFALYFARRAHEEHLDEATWFTALRHMIYGQFIGQTPEGTYFVDYLACMLYEDSATGDYECHLAEHKEAVARAYAKYKHYKYGFVARYHNQTCKELNLTGDNVIVGGAMVETVASAPSDA